MMQTTPLEEQQNTRCKLKFVITLPDYKQLVSTYHITQHLKAPEK